MIRAFTSYQMCPFLSLKSRFLIVKMASVICVVRIQQMNALKHLAYGHALAEPNVRAVMTTTNWEETLIELLFSPYLALNQSFILNQIWGFSFFLFFFSKLSSSTFNLFAHYFQINLFGFLRWPLHLIITKDYKKKKKTTTWKSKKCHAVCHNP